MIRNSEPCPIFGHTVCIPCLSKKATTKTTRTDTRPPLAVTVNLLFTPWPVVGYAPSILPCHFPPTAYIEQRKGDRIPGGKDPDRVDDARQFHGEGGSNEGGTGGDMCPAPSPPGLIKRDKPLPKNARFSGVAVETEIGVAWRPHHEKSIPRTRRLPPSP